METTDQTFEVWICSKCGEQLEYSVHGYMTCHNEWRIVEGESGPRLDPNHGRDYEPQLVKTVRKT